MIISIFELFLIWLLLKKQAILHNRVLLFLSFLTQFFILILYRVELEGFWGRDVYWSDAEYYWNALLSMLEGQKVEVYNILYVFYSYLLQVTSPFVSPLWNNLSNIFLVDLSFLFIIQTLLVSYDYQGSRARIVLNPEIYLVTICNPLVIYSLLRNLKDALFLFLVVFSVYLYVVVFRRFKSRVLILLFSVCYTASFGILLTLVRPWGWIVPIINSFAIPLSLSPIPKIRFFIKSYIPIIISVILAGSFLVFRNAKSVELWLGAREQIMQQTGIVHSPFGLIGAPFRFLLGPGPIRSLLGKQYFWFYTYTGIACSFVGSMFWWFLLPLFVTKVLREGFTRSVFGRATPFFLNFGLFLAVYSFFYGGSAELRLRGVLYIFLGALWVNSWFRKVSLAESGMICKKKPMFSRKGELFVFSTLFAIVALAGILCSF